jgi:hypothetical protein
MLRSRRRVPSPAMAVALLALFLNVAGVTYAASGGTLILGRSNTASSTTSLTASPKKGTALSVKNLNRSGSAASFAVRGSAAPFTVNSSTKVGNLNADRLDGLNSSAFQSKSNIVRMGANQMNFGDARSWDIGPYITINGSCYQSGGTDYLDLSLLNNTAYTGFWSAGILGGPGKTNPATPRENGGAISSGGEDRVDYASYPASSNLVGPSSFGTLIWTDRSGETITATYELVAYVNYCSVEGTLTRAT